MFGCGDVSTMPHARIELVRAHSRFTKRADLPSAPFTLTLTLSHRGRGDLIQTAYATEPSVRMGMFQIRGL